MNHPLRRLSRSFLWTTAQGRLLAILLALLCVALLAEGWHFGRRILQSLRHDQVLVKLGMRRGVAISMNRYQSMLGRDVKLPGVLLKGALCDRAEDDWILFGEAADGQPGFPLDAVALAVRTLRTGLEAPGIDIRPLTSDQNRQKVTYFGGVAGSVVGRWFFDFDYWMKQSSLDRDPQPVRGLPVYWKHAVAELEESVRNCKSSDKSGWSRGNRFWLCAGEFQAVESDYTLVYQSTPMLVLAEKLDKSVWAGSGESPCASKGTDDPLAAEFSNWLTRHLDELRARLPVHEITTFAQLVAAFTWLAEQDPQRDLKPWMQASFQRVQTPDNVGTLAMETAQGHWVPVAGGSVQHEHKLLLSGGVMVSPRLVRTKAGGDTLGVLEHAIMRARPGAATPYWYFDWDRE